MHLDGFTCRGCGAKDGSPLADFGAIPLAHRLASSSSETMRTYPFALDVCNACGLTQMRMPIEPDVHYKGFNFNFSSWKVEPHISDELDLIFCSGAPGSVCEVGANDGRFLELLRERGVKLCVGVEPNGTPAALARQRGFDIYEDYLTDRLVQDLVERYGRFDLVVFRQVLEHIPEAVAFLERIHRLLKDDGHVFLDVPDFAPTASIGDCTTLWEEHVSYFTEKPLIGLLARAGFQPTDVRRYDFSGGCLAVRLEKTAKNSSAKDRDAAAVEQTRAFVRSMEEYRIRIRAALGRYKAAGWTIAMYGAGVRAAAVANILGIGDCIELAIDDQKERQGLYLPSANIPIVSSDDPVLLKNPLICLLAVNNENEAKVAGRLDGLSVEKRVVSVCGPKDIWAGLDLLERGV